MPDPITLTEIAELRRLHEAATPGEWWLQREYDGSRSVCQMRSVNELWCVNRAVHVEGNPYKTTKENGELIVAARNALPRLLDEIERLREENVELKDRLAGVEDALGDAGVWHNVECEAQTFEEAIEILAEARDEAQLMSVDRDKLQAENAQYRAALQMIANCGGNEIGKTK